ncbi:hypothetical protein CPB83DRAFT_769032 [Crepidotus variabilis]|uniref:Transmembrane protein n=1 Tax=Crepidotus variabilis TaxID=179855 RepID=A0A9P6JNK4_9AGAR|nr:hypothetical protein CPB83DRAFT_769032 [Crepidotus variabilis]
MTAVLLALPNPFTPMAFLPPELAVQATVSNYVLVGSLAVLTWDILSNLHSDLRLLREFRVNLSMTVYFISSRIFTLAYLSALVVLETAPTGHCENIRKIQAMYPIAVPSTSLLFFFRVCALYNHNRYLVAFFFISWLSVVAGAITTTQGITGGPIGLTKYCINTRLESYVSLACIPPFVNDTLVFCATTWALMQNSYADGSLRNGLKVMVFGRYLPSFSRAILQDGQVYYATIISLNLVVIVLFFTESVPIVYRSFFGVPNVVLMNVMACYVYRKIRFGVYRETTTLGLGNTTLGKSIPVSGGRTGARQERSGIVFNRVAINGRSAALTERSFKVEAQDERLDNVDEDGQLEVIQMDVVKTRHSEDGGSQFEIKMKPSDGNSCSTQL